MIRQEICDADGNLIEIIEYFDPRTIFVQKTSLRELQAIVAERAAAKAQIDDVFRLAASLT